MGTGKGAVCSLSQRASPWLSHWWHQLTFLLQSATTGIIILESVENRCWIPWSRLAEEPPTSRLSGQRTLKLWTTTNKQTLRNLSDSRKMRKVCIEKGMSVFYQLTALPHPKLKKPEAETQWHFYALKNKTQQQPRCFDYYLYTCFEKQLRKGMPKVPEVQDRHAFLVEEILDHVSNTVQSSRPACV